MSLNEVNRQRLMELAKNSIEHGLQTGLPLKINLGAYPAVLTEPRATFVTLRKNNPTTALRGCIGVLEAFRPLAEDIAENAFSAAFKDPRFPPLEAHELDYLKIHLSILTPAEPVLFNSEQDLLLQLQPGVDGLILKEGYRHGTFLPSVWESLPEPEQFLLNLKQKAGLPSDYWSPTIQIYRYQVEAID
jgi:uncharacterized protein